MPFLSRFTFFITFFVLCGVLPAWAAPTERALTRNDLLGLATQFVKKIGPKLEIQKDEEQKTLNEIPDGEILIFQIQLGKTLRFAGDMFVTKDGDDLKISWRDFIDVMFFPITYDAETGIAEGWYIREDQPFFMDYKNKIVRSEGQEFIIPESVTEDGDDLQIPYQLLGQWFDLTLEPNITDLVVFLDSEETLPIESRVARSKRGLPNRTRYREPSLPRKKEPYKFIDVPNVDVSTGLRYRDPGDDGEETTQISSSLIASGDIGFHTGKLFVSGDDEEQITSVRYSMERDSEDPDLLGPLKARRYIVGDVSPARLPLLGGGSQELGGRITNRKSGGSTRFTNTVFEGDVTPGWDVELYRNNQLIGFLTAEDDGRYVFDDVQLFAGNNDFRLVFYGLQGEIREETRTIPVDVRTLEDNEIYDVSLTFSNTDTYTKNPSDQPEDGAPHLSAFYERPLTNNITGSAGLLIEQQGEEDAILGVASLSTTLYDTLFNANLAVDEEGEAGLEIASRRNLGRHRFSNTSFIATDNFDPDGENTNPTVSRTTFNAKGPLFKLGRRDVNYGANLDYRVFANDDDRLGLNQNINARIAGVSLNHGFDYDKDTKADVTSERFRSNMGVSKRFGRTQYRGIATYEYTPDPGLNTLSARVNRPITRELTAEAQLDHRPKTSFTEGSLKANYKTKNFVISPQLTVDNENEIVATLGTRFGTSLDPRTGEVDFSHKRLSSSGAISAMVYVDENGDGEYNEGELLAEGVKIDAVQSSRKVFTDETGIAFIPDLSEYKTTDVIVDPETFDDPYWISAFEGLSVRPRAGIVTQVDFPLHISGEVDGSIRIIDGNTKKGARNLNLALYNMDGRKVSTTKTAFDGFYIFSLVPPGDYYLMFDDAQMKALGVVRPLPEKITIGYDGTIIYGKDFDLIRENPDNPDVGFTVVADYQDYQSRHAHFSFPAIEDNSIVLNLGSYQSQLMTSVVWYHLKTRYWPILGWENILIPPSQSLPDLDNNLYTLRLPMGRVAVEEGYRKCRSLKARGFACDVEIVPKGLPAGQNEI